MENNGGQGDPAKQDGSVPTDTSGRDGKGRFQPGNKFSTGRKRQEHYRKLFDKSVSKEDFIAVVKALVDQAIGGDVQAAKLILLRCMGREPEHIEITEDRKPVFHVWMPDNGRGPINPDAIIEPNNGLDRE